MKNVVVLGSTGSLGQKTLALLKKYQNDFRLVAISANSNAELLQQQAQDFDLPHSHTLLASSQDISPLAALPEADIIVNVVPGTAGIAITQNALKANKTLLLGNKESLIAAGHELDSNKITKNIIPLDSEHNSIYEILLQHPSKSLQSITLPCSGGPFLNTPANQLPQVTSQQALAHPKWKMGPKVTIESATLINKGFEIIEAHYLFQLPLERIHAKIHPECQIHGLVTFTDGQNIAYLAPPDMTEHIENALLRAIDRQPPQREIRPLTPNDPQLTEPPHTKLPGIQIVLAHFRQSPTKMAHFLKREEQAIQQFLQNEISFPQLFQALEPATV